MERTTTCARCGKECEKHYMIQEIIYLGLIGKRNDICPECEKEFIKWFNMEGEINNV